MLKPEIETTGSFSAVPSNLGSFMASVQSIEHHEDEHLVPGEGGGSSPDDEGGVGTGEAPIVFDNNDQPQERKVVPTNTGRAFARFTDRGMAFGMGMVAHAKSDNYRATPQEMEELEEAFIVFLDDSGIDVSPAVNLIIALSAIYFFKFADVMRDRKENLKREAEEAAADRKRELAAIAEHGVGE